MRIRYSAASVFLFTSIQSLASTACTDRDSPGGPTLSRQGPGGAAFVDIPAVPVELPPHPRPWDTDDQALVEAVAAGDNHAIVAFKEPGSARVKDTGLRAAVTAATIEAACAWWKAGELR